MLRRGLPLKASTVLSLLPRRSSFSNLSLYTLHGQYNGFRTVSIISNASVAAPTATSLALKSTIGIKSRLQSTSSNFSTNSLSYVSTRSKMAYKNLMGGSQSIAEKWAIADEAERELLHAMASERPETVKKSEDGNNPAFEKYPESYTDSWNDVMNKWASVGTKAAAKRTQDIFNKMSNPTAVSLNIVLKAWLNVGDKVGAAGAIAAYNAIVNQAKSVDPDMLSWHAMIHASSILNNGSIQGAMKVEEMLDDMIKAGYGTDVPSWNIVINTYASIGTPDGADMAERTLRRMVAAGASMKAVSTDTLSWSPVIRAYGNLGTFESAAKAERLLNDMVSTDGVGIDSTALNTAMNAWANVGTMEAVQRAESLFHRYVQGADTVTWNTLVKAYSNIKTSEAIKKAQSILEMMAGQGLLHNSCRALSHIITALGDMGTVESVSKAESLLKDALSNPDIAVDAEMWNLVVRAWTRLPNKQRGATESIRLLDEMIAAGLTDHEHVYLNVLEALSKVGTAPFAEAAEGVLDRMPAHLITSQSFAWIHVMQAYANVGTVESAHAAQRVYDRMRQLMNEEGISSTKESDDSINANANANANANETDEYPLNSLILAWVNAGSLRCINRGYTILKDELTRRQHVDKLTTSSGIAVAFRTIINAYAGVPEGKGADKAQEVLDAMIAAGYVPEDNVYTAVAVAWANKGSLAGAEQAERLIQQLHNNVINLVTGDNDKNKDKDKDKDKAHSKMPPLQHWNVVIKAWAEVGTVESAQKVEALRNKICTLYGEEAMKDDFGPHTLLNAWANVGTMESARTTERLFYALPAHASNPIAWNTLIKAWAKIGTFESAQRAEETLNKMIEKGLANSVSWNTVIRCYANIATEASAARAEEVLTRMIPTGLTDIISWNSVIRGWANVGTMRSAEQALSVFERLYDAGLATDPKSWDYIMEAFEKICTREGAQRAEQCLYLMISNKKYWSYPFDVAIRTWASLNTLEGATKAEALLEEKCAAGLTSTSSHGWDAVIKAYGKLNTRDSAGKAEQLLQRMLAADIDVDTWTWNAVINAYALRGDAESAARAEKVCKQMITEYFGIGKEGPSVQSANNALRLSEEDKEGIVFNFNAVMKAYIAVMQGIEQRMNKMKSQQRNRQDKNGRKNKHVSSSSSSSSTSSALTSSSSSSSSSSLSSSSTSDTTESLIVLAEKVESFLQEMTSLGLSPDLYTWNTCINAWATVGNEEGARNADRIFQMFKQQSGTKSSKNIPPPSARSVQPNLVTYSCVLKGWAKIRKSREAALKAEEILNDMIKAGFKTDVVIWTTLMKAWADVGGKEGIEKSEKMMSRMSEHGVEPNIFAFNILSQAYSLHGLTDKHFKLLDSLPKYFLKTHNKVDKYTLPPFFYSIKSIQSPNERRAHLEKLLVFMSNHGIPLSDYVYGLARSIPEFKKCLPLEKWGISYEEMDPR